MKNGKMVTVANGGGQGGGPKADLLFKYGTIPACSMMDGKFMQVVGRGAWWWWWWWYIVGWQEMVAAVVVGVWD